MKRDSEKEPEELTCNVGRRQAIKAYGAAAMAAAIGFGKRSVAQEKAAAAPVLKGAVKHSVCRWCYRGVKIEELAAFSTGLGIKSIELVGPREWPVLKEHGLICAMVPTHGIGKGLNRKQYHSACLKSIRDGIEAAADAGYPNVICFSGNRAGMADDEGLKNCAEALKQVVGLAEEKGITICMELLNSKRSHKDYMCDHTVWGVELCKRVGSPRFKLLYDIFHMQIMEGDVIRTLTDNVKHIAHIHTGGVPGRNEIDETQELNYTAIMRGLVKAGFEGYVGQEFVPKRNWKESLTQAIRICDV